MLALEAVRVRRGGRPILDGVTLSLRPGELVAVIGPNGAGKSTLLHVLAGTLRPDGGGATLDGRPVAAWTGRALALRRGVLPQAAELAFPFPVLDVVLLGRSPHAGRSSRETDLACAEAAMRETDVLDLASRDYTTLSGGERQRVHLARVLCQVWPEDDGDPAARYLLLDEPTSNLDLAHQQSVLEAARRLADGGFGVLAIVHEPNLAARFADRVPVMLAGRLLDDGPPDSVLTEALLQAAFGIRARVLRHPEHGWPYMLPA